MRGVFAKTGVSHDHEIGRRVSNRAHRLLHNSFFVIGAGAEFIFRFRKTKQHYSLNAHLCGAGGFLRNFIDGKVVHAGHRRNLTAHFLTSTGKQRKYEIFGSEARFAHQRAQVFSSSQATGTMKEI